MSTVVNRSSVRRSLTGGFALLATGVAFAGCGSSSGSGAAAGGAAASNSNAKGATATVAGDKVTVDVGTYKINLPKGKGKLNIAFFMNAQANAWQINFAKAAKEQAAKEGDKITMFNSGFDPTTQIRQMINAASSKKFNAAVLISIDTNAECTVATKTLPAAGMLVSVAAQPICGHGDATVGKDMWQPGTLNYVGGDVSGPATSAWVKLVGKANPGPQNVAVVVGPATAATTIGEEAAIKAYAKAHPEFKIGSFINTDYTTPKTYTATLNYLHAHPETTMVMSVYSPDCTRGVMQALAALGKVGKIKVADQGGAQYAVDQIKSGTLQLTMPYFPELQAQMAVASLQQAAAGGATPSFVSNVPSKYGTWDNPLPVTKDNVATFVPEY
jgi:ribose transport system substrate-binding protein